jgi:hypothetical protein
MKTASKINILFFAFAVVITACHGDKGEIGPKGPTGDTGTTGETGTGFDELKQYGNIIVTFSGTRNDDVTFTRTIDFVYMPVSGVRENSSLYKYNDTDFEFFVGRENKGSVSSTGRTNDGGFKNSVWIDLSRNALDVSISEIDLYTDIITDDLKTFSINTYDGSWNESFDAPVTNYSYDAATGKLKFDFSYTIPAYSSSTGNDIIVEGKADLTVFQRLDMPG